MFSRDRHGRTEPRQSSFRRRLLWGSAITVTILILAILAAPWVAASDWLRDRVLNAALQNSQLELASGSADFNWTNPVRVDDLTISSPEEQLAVEVNKLRFDRPWWQLWLYPDELGHIRLAEPTAEVRLNWDQFEGYGAGTLPSFSATIDGGELVVNLESIEGPVVDVHRVDITVRLESDESGDRLVIDEPFLLGDRQLTAERCSELLQLIDPMLSDVVEVEGQFTLEVDHLSIPINADPDQQRREIQLAGRLKLHDVTTSAKTPLLRGIIRVAADLYGRPPSDVVRVVNRSSVEFEVRDGRLYHHGLAFGLPDIDPDLLVRSEGFVSLDETLDLQVAIPKLFLAEENSAQAAAKQLAELRIRGTIRDPEVIRLGQNQETASHESPSEPSGPSLAAHSATSAVDTAMAD